MPVDGGDDGFRADPECADGCEVLFEEPMPVVSSDCQFLDRSPTADRACTAEIGRPVLDVDHHAVGSEERREGFGIAIEERDAPPRASRSGDLDLPLT